MNKKFFYVLIPVVLAAVILLPGYFYWKTTHYTNDAQRKEDIELANAENAECLLLSMIKPEYISLEIFTHNRGVTTTRASHTFTNLYDITDFLDAMTAAHSSVYLVLDPAEIASLYGYHTSLYEKAYQNTLLEAVRSDANVTFEFLLAFPSVSYWSGLSDSELENTLASYRDFVNLFAAESNVRIYFPGAEEWLIANPGNYESDRICTESIMTKTVHLTIDGLYVLSAEDLEAKLDTIRILAAGTSAEPLLGGTDTEISTDLSDMDLVFFGDSVIGNFNDSTSIPGVAAGLTGAQVYNLGLGGITASSTNTENDISLMTVVNAFLSGNSSLQTDNTQIAEELEKYFNDHADGSERETCFLLNFGLNDYFEGLPISTPATDEPDSCCTGALREAVSSLRAAFPDCRIILMTPTFCTYFENGTVAQSDIGGVLEDYANAISDAASELGVEVIDNYRLGINSENAGTYLSDGCHPNEQGRYIIGRKIVEML